MIEQVRVKDLPDDLVEDIQTHLKNFLVGIFILEEDGIRPSGSGTLVQYREVYGILTARHVVENIKGHSDIGFVIREGKHRFTIEQHALEYIVSDTGKSEESGPDIAFIKIPDADIGLIKAYRSFANLELHSEKVNNEANCHGLGVWCLCGFPDELSATNQDGNIIAIDFYGQVGIGAGKEDPCEEGEFDYFWQKIVYSETNNPPENYQGVSGGGLWQAVLVKDKTLRVSDYILRGVAFYQTAKKGNRKTIKCHGEKSIYSYILNRIKEKYS